MPLDQPALLFRGPDGIVETERATGVELARSELVAGGVGYVPGTTGDAPSGPFVVATDLQRNVVVVMDAATLLPDDDINGDPRVESLPSPAVGPIEVRGRGDDAQVWVPVGPLPADDEHPAVRGGITVFDERVQEIDTAPLPGSPSLIGWQSVANIIYIAGFDESSRATGGVDRPADRQRWHPERWLRGLRHDPAQRAAAGHGLRRVGPRPGRGPRASAGLGGG